MAAAIDVKALAEIGVALSFADGDLDPRELAMLLLAMEDLGVPASAAEAAVDSAVERLGSGEGADEVLAAAAARVPVKSRPAVFEACAHVLMGDGAFAEAEVQRLAAVKTLLAIDDAVALRIVASAAVGSFEANGGLEIGR